VYDSDACRLNYVLTRRSLLLRKFESSSSDPPQAIEREEVGEDRLHKLVRHNPKKGITIV
jgi:hypothetical protein